MKTKYQDKDFEAIVKNIAGMIQSLSQIQTTIDGIKYPIHPGIIPVGRTDTGSMDYIVNDVLVSIVPHVEGIYVLHKPNGNDDLSAFTRWLEFLLELVYKGIIIYQNTPDSIAWWVTFADDYKQECNRHELDYNQFRVFPKSE